jgi:hypothetical protein
MDHLIIVQEDRSGQTLTKTVRMVGQHPTKKDRVFVEDPDGIGLRQVDVANTGHKVPDKEVQKTIRAEAKRHRQIAKQRREQAF